MEARTTTTTEGNINGNSEVAPLLSLQEDHHTDHVEVKIERNASWFQTFANLVQNVLGTGGLALGSVFAQCGLSGGLFLVVVIGIFSCASLLLIAYLVRRDPDNSPSVQHLALVHVGPRFSFFCSLLVLIFMWGSGIILLQIIRDNTQHIAQYISPSQCDYFNNSTSTSSSSTSSSISVLCDGRLLITLLSVVFIFPLTLLPSFTFLSFASSFGVLCTAYAFGFVLVQSGVTIHSQAPLPTIQYGWITSLMLAFSVPTIVFSYMTHVAFVPMLRELRNPSNGRVFSLVASSMAICLVIYAMLGSLPYVAIGPNIQQYPNVLSVYPPSYPPAIVARIAVSVQMLFGYPIGLFVGRLTIAHLLHSSFPSHTAKRALFSLVWMSPALAIAVGVTDISLAFTFVGSTTPLFFMFVFPTLMLAKLKPSPYTWTLFILASTISLAAAVLAIVASFLP